MENTRIDTATGSALESGVPPCLAEKSRPASKKSSKTAQVADDGAPAETMRLDILPELALLQSIYDAALERGLQARTQIGVAENNRPVLIINLFDVMACNTCGSWHADETCLTCEAMKEGK